MANILFLNNATSLLAASIDSLDVTIQLGSGDGALFPSPTGPQYFVATLEDDAGAIEIVQCTSRTGDLLTVVRGFDNSVAQSFAMTVTRIELRLTSVVVEEFIQKNGDIMEGDLDMNGNNLVDGVLTGPNTQILAGEIVGVPLRGDTGVSTNEIDVPSGGGRATAGGAEIRVAGDDITADVASATESAEGIAEIADQTEMDAGTDDVRFVTPKKFRDTAATDTQRGTLRTATVAQTETGTNDTRAVTPAAFAGTAAAEGQIGTIAIADQATVDAGVDDTQAVTAAKLAAATSVPGVFRGCTAYKTGAQAMGVNAAPIFDGTGEIAVTFDLESFDTDSIHAGGMPSRFVVPAGVSRVRLSAGWRFNMGGAGGIVHSRFVRSGLFTGSLDVAGPTVNAGQSPNQGAGSVLGQHMTLVSPVMDVTPGDYFEVYTTVQGNTATIAAGTAWFSFEILA